MVNLPTMTSRRRFARENKGALTPAERSILDRAREAVLVASRRDREALRDDVNATLMVMGAQDLKPEEEVTILFRLEMPLLAAEEELRQEGR